MKCAKCGKEGEFILLFDKAICSDCMRKQAPEICPRTGKTKTFACSHICNECDMEDYLE